MQTAIGHTVSDLHLLTNRSSAEKMMPSLHRAASKAGLFVLNGDIFDFQWSVYPDLEQSLRYVERWIADLVGRHPKCQFVFITGNHDSLPNYEELLEDLSRRHANLAWDPFYLTVGEKVFLHGDVHNSPTPETLEAYRSKWHGPPRKAWAHTAYFVFAWLRIPRLIHELMPTHRPAADVITYLKAELGPRFHDVQDVYYGHTHKPHSNFLQQGLRFHNTGATLHGVRSRIQTFLYDPADLERGLRERNHHTGQIGAGTV
jgi:UDP-2,3-diacylglucosamine pyrophosphatase LpxH